MQKTIWKSYQSAFVELHTELTKLSKLMHEDAVRHRELSLRETVEDTWSFKILTPVKGSTIHKEKNYALLLEKFLMTEMYDPVAINDVMPDAPSARYWYLKKLKENGLVLENSEHVLVLYTRAYGNNIESLHYGWLVPANQDTDDDRMRKTQRHCEQQAPAYFSRQLKRKFNEIASSMDCQTSKAKLRRLYAVATGDASAARSKQEAAVDQRVLDFIELEDDSIVCDLRKLNHQESVFDVFFDTAATILDEEIGSAVDDRRQDTVVHLARAVSANDLYK